MGKGKFKPYRVIGAYDSETTNITDGAFKSAFPILHQLGLIDVPIETIDNDNVERLCRLYLYRHSIDLYNALDRIVSANVPYVPVVLCHNLSFDMYGLSPWLSRYEVRVLAKSQRKPISFTILDDDGNARLVIWDTLVFSQKSLGYMGNECGYKKLSGDWDYSLVRTPETPLSDREKAYAAHDVYSLLAWVGYWCRLNPDIDPCDLGLRVVSKTGVVRRRRVLRFSKLKGRNFKRDVGHFWGFINSQNMFEDDDELYTCQAATRGGLTFCARENASKVYDFGEQDGVKVYGFDATSQHPSQMVSHRYPVRFKKATPENLELAFGNISLITIDDVLEHYEKPFPVAFYGAFEFENLRLKSNTPFGDWGIAPLAWARCKRYERDATIEDENQQGEEFREHMAAIGYKDQAEDPVHSFGKLEGAQHATLWLTELAAWEVCQAYDFDNVKAVSGYMTLSFDKPPDMAVISVMQFYAAKNAFKHARGKYYANEPLDNAGELIGYGIPQFVMSGMQEHTIDDSTVESTYLGLKADLNALFGIEASNEYRRDTVLGDSGIEYTGEFGIVNAPEHPRAWYQFGQRIVGWSRIAQCIVLMLCYPHVETCINGDTDSVKFAIRNAELDNVRRALGKMDRAIDTAKRDVCSRVRKCYPEQFDELEGIGHYVLEFSTFRFCAAWNKAYCISEYDPRDNREHVRFTLAGVPSGQVNRLADRLVDQGWSFAQVCDTFLGYNVTYAHDITGLNARSFPDWGDMHVGRVTDYRGIESFVTEPAALCLYPMSKTVNDVQSLENMVNMGIAMRNRPSVNVEPVIVTLEGVTSIKEMIASD